MNDEQFYKQLACKCIEYEFDFMQVMNLINEIYGKERIYGTVYILFDDKKKKINIKTSEEILEQ